MLLQMSISGGTMILLITILRSLTMDHLPKKLFTVLWDITLLRLLLPFYLPLRYGITSPVTDAVDRIDTGLWSDQVIFIKKSADKINGDAFFRWFFEGDRIRAIWLSVMVVMLLFFGISYLRERRKLRTVLPISEDAEDLLRMMAEIPERIKIRISDQIQTPLTFGVMTPKIILPKAWGSQGDAEWRYILTHEMIHIRRFDNLRKILILIAVSIHWFNPFVWMMYVLYNRDIELSCDEKVIATLGEDTKKGYAMALVNLAEKHYEWSLFSNGFGKNAIQERIVAIMKYKRVTTVGIISAVILTGVAFTAFAQGETETSDNGQGEKITVRATDLQSVSSADSGADEGNETGDINLRLKDYESYGITYNTSSKTLEYNGKEIFGLEDGGVIYINENADDDLTYLAINGDIVKELSEEEFDELINAYTDKTEEEVSVAIY